MCIFNNLPPHNECSLVTIFMPVYNGERFLKKSIESIINQTYTNWELLCVDDSSKDNSLEILEGYASKDDRIKWKKLKSQSLLLVIILLNL